MDYKLYLRCWEKRTTVFEDEIHFLMYCPFYNEAHTEAGLQHFAHNAASFVQIMMEGKLKAVAQFLFTAFSTRENSDAFKP
jgi:hypothetical protein